MAVVSFFRTERMAQAIADTASLVTYRHYIPPEPLREFVGLIWYWRGHEADYSRERVMPSASPELIINLGSGRKNSAGITGPRSEAAIIELTAADELIGIHFNPGGAFPFIRCPLDELYGRGVTLSDLWGEQAAAELIDRLLASPTAETKFRVMEQWLLSIKNQPLHHHPAIAFSMSEFQKDPRLLSSAVMADRVGFSQRHFIELFKKEVGLNPKLFCRIQRFRKAIESIHGHRDVDWVDVALSCGYFDQSHFNHDFRRFSGLRPGEYLSLQTDHPTHVRITE
jgi:AraC-like DNA-binding protein